MRSHLRLILVLAAPSISACGATPVDPTSSASSAFASSVLYGQRDDDRHAPRLIAPLSGSHTANQNPTFVWQLPPGARRARVDICRDHACANVVQTFEVSGTTARPPAVIPGGALFWRVTALGAGRRPSPPSATWELWGTGMLFPQPGLAGPPADTATGSVLDINADGFADLVVGAPGTSAGLVHVYLGGPAGPAATPSQTLSGPAGFGQVVASAGDVNGDGFIDVAVTTSTGAGAVQVFLGSATGLGARATALDRGAVTTGFGASLSTAGDVDGDGYGDLLVGGLEVAQVYRGGARGIAVASSIALGGADAGNPGSAPNAQAVTGGGDVNGDRLPDAVINGHSYLGTGGGFTLQATAPFQIGLYAGDINGDGLTDYADGPINPGSPDGLSQSPFWAFAGELFFTGTGDTNGDGFAEAIAAVSSLTGFPEPWRVHYGNPLPCTSNSCGGPQNGIALPGARPPFSGWAAAGDLDGNGFEDVAVGVAADGAVYLFMAPDVPPTPTRMLTGAGDNFGASVQ